MDLHLPLTPDGSRRFAYLTVPDDITPAEGQRLISVLRAWLPGDDENARSLPGEGSERAEEGNNDEA